MKVSSRDLLGLLREFGEANDVDVPRLIDRIVTTQPETHNTLVSFHFKKTAYFALYDESAEDDEDYIRMQIASAKTEATGELLRNPRDEITTYAMPYKGKDVYLFKLISTKNRLDAYLAEHYPEHSRSTWQKMIKAGLVRVNGEPVVTSKYDVATTDKVSVQAPEEHDFSAETLSIIHQDDEVIVVNKPIGVLTHSKGALNDEFTVADFFRRFTTDGLDTSRPGIVHRLDRDTSGVIIGARSEATALLLKKQFSNRTVKKTYLAIVTKPPADPRGLIDVPIARNPKSPSTFRVDVKGKSAQTYYEVLAVNAKGHALVKLQPTTGRTHQLRVHLAYIGCPIVGDRVYGKAGERLFLHAYQLEITIPTSDRRVFTAPIPKVFQDQFDEEIIL